MQQTSCTWIKLAGLKGPASVLMTVVAVDLAADFTAGPGRAVDIDVSSTRTNGLDELVNFSSVQSLVPRRQSGGDIRTDVGCQDCARYRRGWCRAGLDSRRSVAEVGAQEDRYTTIHTHVSYMDVGLLNRAFEI